MSSAAVNYTSLEFALTDVEIGILCAVNIIFSILGSLGNILVCFAFLHFPKLRNTMNIFILSLACSALLVCILAQPMYTVSLVKHYQQQHITNVFEKVRKCLTWISLLGSAGNLFGVTLDRYHAIAEPFSEHQGVRPSAFIFVIVIWFIAIGLGTSTAFQETIKLVALLYVFVLVICLILPLYIRILRIAAKHRQKILASQSYRSNLTVPDQVNQPTHSKYRLRLRNRIDRGALKTVGVICVVFVLGWFPLLILPLVYRTIEDDRKLILLDLFQWVNTIALCSSAVNPIVYAATDKRFREALKIMYRKWVTRRQDFGGKTSRSRSSKQSNESG